MARYAKISAMSNGIKCEVYTRTRDGRVKDILGCITAPRIAYDGRKGDYRVYDADNEYVCAYHVKLVHYAMPFTGEMRCDPDYTNNDIRYIISKRTNE